MSSSIKYIKPFDGMRGIGVLMIILYHFPGKYITISHGWEFMQLFFVMSGYLITMVLLEDKSKYSFKDYSLFFYLKRILRLFPLYFAYLFFWIIVFVFSKGIVLLQLASKEVVQHAPYLFTYTYNYMTFVNYFMGWDYKAGIITTHLWTLSVEEQFYLVFPFFVYFLENETLKKVVLAAIIIAPVFRIFFYFFLKDINPNDISWVSQNLIRIPFSQMDSIAIGAALALFKLDWIKKPVRIFWITTLAVVMVYAGNIAYVYFVEGTDYYTITFGKKLAENWITHNYLFSYLISLVNIWCALALYCVIKGNTVKWLLENAVLVFIGRLSYGIYILHLPIMFTFGILINSIPFIRNHANNIFVEAAVLGLFLLVLLVITYISFHYFEKKFINMRHRIFVPKLL
jgi:peptidoglycan/LPS O-acetylase OafA/YrhL